MEDKKLCAVQAYVAKAPIQQTTEDFAASLAALSSSDTVGTRQEMQVPLHLTHISVGDAYNEPTVEELSEILARFIGPEPFCEPNYVKVREYEFYPANKAVLTLGTRKWVPTTDELKAVRENLAHVLVEGGVLVTHYSAKLTFLDGPSYLSFTVKATQ